MGLGPVDWQPSRAREGWAASAPADRSRRPEELRLVLFTQQSIPLFEKRCELGFLICDPICRALFGRPHLNRLRPADQLADVFSDCGDARYSVRSKFHRPSWAFLCQKRVEIPGLGLPLKYSVAPVRSQRNGRLTVPEANARNTDPAPITSAPVNISNAWRRPPLGKADTALSRRNKTRNSRRGAA